MEKIKNIKAVIFDLDNTLADRKYAFDRHAEQCADDFIKDKSQRREFIKRLTELDLNGYRPKKEVYDTVSAEFELNCSPEEIMRTWNVNADRFIRPVPNAEEVLEKLSGKYILGLLTNGCSKTQNIKLDRVGLRKYFKEVIISEDAGIAKPDREIFLMICRKLSVSPENCVYIGDHFENDIKGAMGAGMSAVLFDPDGTSGEGCSRVISSLEEIENILE